MGADEDMLTVPLEVCSEVEREELPLVVVEDAEEADELVDDELKVVEIVWEVELCWLDVLLPVIDEVWVVVDEEADDEAEVLEVV